MTPKNITQTQICEFIDGSLIEADWQQMHRNEKERCIRKPRRGKIGVARLRADACQPNESPKNIDEDQKEHNSINYTTDQKEHHMSMKMLEQSTADKGSKNGGSTQMAKVWDPKTRSAVGLRTE